MTQDHNGQAAIVSPAVARGAPMLRAIRHTPVLDGDSGWSFDAGGDDDADVAGTRVWSLAQVAAREPTLAPLLAMPPGTTLERRSPADP